jgi:asparagine synthase (glutamine-hydrolysing)
MSAIAGCFWRDGRPAAHGDLRPALESIRHRTRRDLATAVCGPVALAAPDTHSSGSLQIAFHGRIDNADDVRARLGIDRPSSDAGLALAACRALGVEAGAWLEGDFAFAMWDAVARRFTCIRDGMGQRPLFYAVLPQAVVIGSEPQQILRHPGVPRDVDERAVAEYLSGLPLTVEATLWTTVRRLPPGHALVATADRVDVRRVWDFDPAFKAGCKTDGDYADRFRALFATAVSRRATTRPAVFLSGGIDSSAVAAMAARLTPATDGPVRGFSVTFPGRACDESPYIESVRRHCGVQGSALAAAPATRDAVCAEVDRYLDVPAYPNGSVMDPLRLRAAAEGASVVMTGYGGDEWFGARRPDSHVVRRVVRRLVPAAIRRTIRHARARSLSSNGTSVPKVDWIAPGFAGRTCIADRLEPSSPAFASASQRKIYAVVRSATQVVADELEERAASAAGIEQRHPFYDRALAEFGLSLPDAQRFADGKSKAVVRRALRDLLPPDVAARTDKAEFSATFVDALESLGGASCFERLRIEAIGWVDGDAVRRRYARMMELYRLGNESYIPWTDGLWEVAALELWLRRAVEGDHS